MMDYLPSAKEWNQKVKISTSVQILEYEASKQLGNTSNSKSSSMDTDILLCREKNLHNNNLF